MAMVNRAPEDARFRAARGQAMNEGAAEAGPNELNHRQRKQVYMHSEIFDKGGPSGASIYAQSAQNDRHDERLKPNLGKAAVPEFHCPTPADMRCTQNAGHGVVIESGYGTSGLNDVVRAEKDNGSIPKEFMQTSVNLQWCDPRNDLSRKRDTGRSALSAQVLKRTEFSSELFGQTRQVDMSTRAAPKELHAETWNPLESDSAVDHHLRGDDEAQANRANFDDTTHRHRASKNLASSTSNLAQDSAWGAAPGVSPQQAGGEDYSTLQRRRNEKNYSDLFGHTMGEQSDVRQNRHEVTATSTCSFLDTKSEIAGRNKSKKEQQADRVGPSPPAGALAELPVNVSKDRKGDDLNSTLFDHQCHPKPTEDQQTQQVNQNERICWDTRDIMQTQSEIARRGRNRGFVDDPDRTHAQRKVNDLGSNNLRRALGAPEVPESAPNPHRMVSRGDRPVAAGVGKVDKVAHQVTHNERKQTEMQSSIFKDWGN